MTITKASSDSLNELFQIYLNAKEALDANHIFQWIDSYPTISIIENDLKKGVLYALEIENEIVGAINLNEEQDKEYQTIDWLFDDTKVLVVHRLVVNPTHQKKGYGKVLMDFAEDFAKNNNYSSIRLDTYSRNKSNIRFYQNRNYFIRGNVYFSGREHPFHCMEKSISKAL